jgi:hypothetical protein
LAVISKEDNEFGSPGIVAVKFVLAPSQGSVKLKDAIVKVRLESTLVTTRILQDKPAAGDVAN